jgi:hypothetical protein
LGTTLWKRWEWWYLAQILTREADKFRQMTSWTDMGRVVTVASNHSERILRWQA